MADDFVDLRDPASVAERLLMDAARKIQLTPTQHQEATRNFYALADYVDGSGSELAGMVIKVSPSGSFSYGAPILGQIRNHQHDVDAIIELDTDPFADPQLVLESLFRSIKRTPDSRYYSCTTLGSRCVTVTYKDGRTADLMPVVRLPHLPERVVHLFHFKAEEQERYHREVNPSAFTEHFKASVRASTVFTKAFAGHLEILAKAETEQFPAYEALDQKSPRVVALQLIKRARDKAYRRETHDGQRKPPSIVIAALSLEIPTMSDSLVTETLTVARYVLARLQNAHELGKLLDVRNPKWTADKFTDRWPSTLSAQSLYIRDLTNLVAGLHALSTEALSPEQQARILRALFGETVATYAVDRLYETFGHAHERGRTFVGQRGHVAILPAAAPSIIKRPKHGGRK